MGEGRRRDSIEGEEGEEEQSCTHYHRREAQETARLNGFKNNIRSGGQKRVGGWFEERGKNNWCAEGGVRPQTYDGSCDVVGGGL